LTFITAILPSQYISATYRRRQAIWPIILGPLHASPVGMESKESLPVISIFLAIIVAPTDNFSMRIRCKGLAAGLLALFGIPLPFNNDIAIA
jgi:hypothetical protein